MKCTKVEDPQEKLKDENEVLRLEIIELKKKLSKIEGRDFEEELKSQKGECSIPTLQGKVII